MKDGKKLLRVLSVSIILALLSLAIYTNSKYYELVVVFIMHISIVVLLLQIALLDIIKKKQISLYPLFLVSYEANLVVRIFFALTNSNPGLYYFIIGTIFETLLGLFFCIFREDNQKLIIYNPNQHNGQ